MGSGYYSSTSRHTRLKSTGFYEKSSREIFTRRNVNNAMDPHNVKFRESRDSDDHPNSFPIIIALDVTGSMGTIPDFLVRNGLPNIMNKIIEGGIKDPQVLFLAVGDHECDRSPLQIGQFESSDELLDHWLTNVWLEGGGGGNDGESYHLAWYFAGLHTVHDHFEKRGKKGVLFTIGDEPVLSDIPRNIIKGIMGEGQHSDYTASDLLEKARKLYNCYHIHMLEGYNGNDKNVQDSWKQIMKNDLIFAKRKESIENIISDKVIEVFKSQYGDGPFLKDEIPEDGVFVETEQTDINKDEVML